MFAEFDVFEMQGIFRVTEETLAQAEKICDSHSGDYSTFILGICWANNLPLIFADGPWEC